MASISNLPEDYVLNVVGDSRLQVFEWNHFKISTEYLEPYDVARAGNNATMVSKENTLPQRKFTVEFPTMFHLSADFERYWMYKQGLSLKRLVNFYERMGTHGRFIFKHPVYGECVCRFLEPLDVPKRKKNGLGSVESFKVTLIEENSKYFFLDKDERFYTDLTFGFPHHQTSVKYPATSVNLALGNNYTVKVRDFQKPLRTFIVTIPLLGYFLVGKDKLSFKDECGFNALRLELFYLNKRLSEEFIFKYEEEDVIVKFNKPLSIPNVKGNMGKIVDLEIELRESRGAMQVEEVEMLEPVSDPCVLTSRIYPIYFDETIKNSFKLDLVTQRTPLNTNSIDTENVKSEFVLNNILYRTPLVKLPVELEQITSVFSMDKIHFRSTVNRYDLETETVKSTFKLDSILFRSTVNRTNLDLEKITSTFKLDKIEQRGAVYKLNLEQETFTTDFTFDSILFRTVMGKLSLETDKATFGFVVQDSQITKQVIYSELAIEVDKSTFGFVVQDSQVTYSVDYLDTNLETENLGVNLKLGSAKITRKVRYLETAEQVAESTTVSLKLGSAKVTRKVDYPESKIQKESFSVSLKLGSARKV